MPRVSVLIPSRNERFLPQTVADVLAKARGDLEVIVILDGYWPDPPLPEDPRVRLHHVGTAQGMRPGLTAAARIATGDYLMKLDAHCMVAEGFDVQLLADYHEDTWVLVPRRYALDPVTWTIDRTNGKYPVDAHYISNPFNTPSNSTPGLHGSNWTARRDARAHVEIDDELSSQGSCWFMSRAQWARLGGLDAARYGSFWHEFQEIGFKTWLSGGAVKVTKRTWYAHLFKGKKWGRGYSLKDAGHEQGSAFCTWFWMTDQPFPGRTRTLRSLIEQFAPVPTWPDDLGPVFAEASTRLSDPYANRAFEWRAYCASQRSVPMSGFSIVSAYYGPTDTERVDVTEVVRGLATDTGLIIPAVSNDVLQTGNVFKGQRKRLTVEYEIAGTRGTANALERKSLVIPVLDTPPVA